MGNFITRKIKRLSRWLQKRRPDRIYAGFVSVQSMNDVPADPGGNIFIVERGGVKRWAVLKCPNSHKGVLEINLMESKEPFWKIKIKKNKISLWPSVWSQSESCQDHFWLKDNQAFLVKFDDDEY
ncbi:MAG: DUF6527 family protein [Patescibacteria group bacterium]|nr:DUF6527 family protein [Patescibacteria group bacterium]